MGKAPTRVNADLRCARTSLIQRRIGLIPGPDLGLGRLGPSRPGPGLGPVRCFSAISPSPLSLELPKALRSCPPRLACWPNIERMLLSSTITLAAVDAAVTRNEPPEPKAGPPTAWGSAAADIPPPVDRAAT